MRPADSGDNLAELSQIIEDALILALMRQGVDSIETEPVARSIAEAIETAVHDRQTVTPEQAMQDGLEPDDLSAANDI
jgi:hypothetical protein